MGPAVSVLADQHQELVQMLGALRRLGKVGARVIGASKENLIATLTHLRPVLTKLNAAGKSLAPGLDMMISFPFPQEAAEVVKGDYANASIRAGINLETFLPDDGGGGGGGGPLGPIPDPTEALNAVQKCLNNGRLGSAACQKVIRDPAKLRKLKRKCQRPKHQGKPVCQAIAPTPEIPSDNDGPTVPPLPFPRLDTDLSAALSSGRASPTYAGLFGFGGWWT
jgi:phospholipid/cholesterol/gamma-HCH transport system substrate-binding protein